MPDVVVSDPHALGQPGVIEIRTDPTQVRAIGSNLHIEVLTTSVVTIKGTDWTNDLFLYLTIRFNGGSADPTVLEAIPQDYWGPPPWTQDARFGVYYDGDTLYQFRVMWSHTGYTPPLPVVLTNVTGVGGAATFNAVAQVRYFPGGPFVNQYDVWGFEMRMGTTPVFPVNGETCTLIFYQAGHHP